MSSKAAFFLSLIILLGSLNGRIGFGEEKNDFEHQYSDAEHSYLNGDSSAANQLLTKILSSKTGTTDPKIRVRALNLRGLISFQKKQLGGAIQEFEAAVDLASRSLEPTESVLHLARYNLINALHQNKRTAEAEQMISLVNPDALDRDTRIRFYHLAGNIYADLNQPLASVTNFFHAAAESDGLPTEDSFLQKAYQESRSMYLLDPKADVDAVENLKSNLKGSNRTQQAIKLVLAKGYLYLGESDKASSLIAEFIDQADENHILKEQAKELLRQLEKLSNVEPTTIGLLLPLSGRFARFGRLCMSAAFMAMGAYEDSTAPEAFKKFKFAIRDSGDTEESAIDAFDKLIFEDQAIGVIGPLLSKQFPIIAQKAQEYGTPLLSLSQRKGGFQEGAYVFPLALSPDQQVNMVVDYAIEKRGLKRFAILAPNDNFGQEYVDLFWDAVEQHGGKIVGYEKYTPKTTDFRDEVRALLGLDYAEARALETKDLQRHADQFAQGLKVRGRLKQRMLQAFDLKGVADFDALFIPDDPQTVGQIAPALAVEDVSGVPFLGINTWNSPEIIQRAGRYLQNSVFVDAFFAQSKNPLTSKFSAEYTKLFNAAPGSLEVQSYDAATMLLKALSQQDVSTRADLRNSLGNLGTYVGISGDFHLTPTGVKRTARLLTIHGNQIIEIPHVPTLKTGS